MSQGVQNSSGLLLVDKPTGVTSHTVVAHVRKSLLRAFPQWDPRQRPGRKKIKGGPRPPRFKCGHAGTLDPLATGLLLILVGKASRLSPFLMGMDKSYLATVQFGEATDSLDSDGEVVASAAVPADPGIIVEQLSQFRGDILQVPPMISALKHEGQPLYKLVRQGKPLPELKARPVTISNFEVKDTRWSEAQMDFLVDCTSGTYIRSLARDVAQAAGTEGHIAALRRLNIGPFLVDGALQGVMQCPGENLAEAMIPLSEALPHVPSLQLTAEETSAVRQGIQPNPLWLDRCEESPSQGASREAIFRMIGPGNSLVAVGKLDNETGTPLIAAVIPAETEDSAACD